jgi:hypothetical protein
MKATLKILASAMLLLSCKAVFAQMVTAGNDGYVPQAGECPVDKHKEYTTTGRDGHTYYTWHPPVDPSGCPFGHEHGDDPRLSKIPDFRMPAFGEVAHASTQQALLQHLHEDHVGFKVFVENGISVSVSFMNSINVHAIITFHQGGHGPNAFSANLHEQTYQFYAEKGGKILDVDAGLLSVVGRAGVLNLECLKPVSEVDTYPSLVTDVRINPLVPGKSPGTRVIAFDDCVEKSSWQGLTEAWRTNEVINGMGLPPKFLQIAAINPGVYHFMSPGRYYNDDIVSPNPADHMAYYVDSCYLKNPDGSFLVRSNPCPGLRTRFPAGISPMSPDVPKEFKACLRTHRIASLAFMPVVVNGMPVTDWYTDSRGWNASATAFEGSFPQHMRNDFGKFSAGVAKAFGRDHCHPTTRLPN